MSRDELRMGAIENIAAQIEVSPTEDGRFVATNPLYPGYSARGNTHEEAYMELVLELCKVEPRLQRIYYRRFKAKLLEDLKSELNRRGLQAMPAVRVRGRHELYEMALPQGKVVFYLKYGAIFWGADQRFLEELRDRSEREGARCFLVLLGPPNRHYCIPILQALALIPRLSISRDGQVKIKEEHLDYRWQFSTVSALVDSILSE